MKAFFLTNEVSLLADSMNKKVARFGVLTSGGDCPGLNAVVRAVVKSTCKMGGEVFGFFRGFEGLAAPVSYQQLDEQNTSGILIQGGTILGSTNKGRFVARKGIDDRVELDPELLVEVSNTYEHLGLDALICIGGDGSLSIANQFHEYGLPVIGVPKTIDNDLSSTAFTFGFDSAVACATDALDRLHTTASAHERIMVLEVMGRHAGWIALHAGIAGGADIIVLPEIDWSFEGICQAIQRRENAGKKFSLVVVAEGAELPNGELVTQERRQETIQTRLGGIGNLVATELETRLQRETRSNTLGHLQRGGSPTSFDRVLATQYGTHAVRLAHEQKWGHMVCYVPPNEISSVPIELAVNKLRQVDPGDSVVQTARMLGISFGEYGRTTAHETSFLSSSQTSEQSVEA